MATVPADESLKAIANRLRLVRLAYGKLQGREKPIQQAEFAELCGISKQMWNTAEKARKRLGLDNAKAVFRRTGADLQFIYFGTTTQLPLALAREMEAIEEEEAKASSRNISRKA